MLGPDRRIDRSSCAECLRRHITNLGDLLHVGDHLIISLGLLAEAGEESLAVGGVNIARQSDLMSPECLVYTFRAAEKDISNGSGEMGYEASHADTAVIDKRTAAVSTLR